MKKRRKSIPVYGDDNVTLTVLVDANNEAWLTPGQIEHLESIYNWKRYYYSLDVPATSGVKTSDYKKSVVLPSTAVVQERCYATQGT